ncbi:MAG: cytidylyltransferase domain-containing protein [Candidatus Hodarchaeota archaeon]
MIAAIIQARMGSMRLPGKVLLDISGQPMLWHVVNRVRRVKRVDKVFVATSDEVSDDPIVAFCEEEGISCFRGSSDNVLDRYYQAAKWLDADVIVRITADCPLIDPEVLNDVVEHYMEGDFDYVSNIDPPTFPDGLDIEVFSCQTLQWAWREAKLQSEREHVTPYIRRRPQLFRIGNVTYKEDLSKMRWTVDEPADLEFVRAVYEYLGSMSFGLADVLNVLKNHPELMEINAGIGRNEGYQKSVREERAVNTEHVDD